MYIHLYRMHTHAHTRRNDMTISSFRKNLIPSLAMASAAFFGGTAGARAADLTSSDPQEQARQLLAPTKPGRPVALSGSSSAPSGVVESAVEPQELARRLLARADSSKSTAIAAPAIGKARVGRDASPGDSQALAQRMILGARGAAKTRTATAALSRDALE
jgi:hypothetical protein